jgi:hypothetical protein
MNANGGQLVAGENSFDKFGHLLQEMIKDANLAGAFDALNCLYSFVRFAPDIKTVTRTCHMFLLDKVQHTKHTFREICSKTLLEMLKRNMGALVFPELMKRFKSKNTKLGLFAMGVVADAFKTRTGMDSLDLRMVFKSLQTVLTNRSDEVRDGSYAILEHVYANCSDDAENLIKHCTKLRGVQATQLKEML